MKLEKLKKLEKLRSYLFEFFEEEALGDGEGGRLDGIDVLLDGGLEFLVVGQQGQVHLGTVFQETGGLELVDSLTEALLCLCEGFGSFGSRLCVD